MPFVPQPGRSHPLGATPTAEGVNFCVFSKNCQRVELLLFDEGRYDRPAHVLPFDQQQHRSFYYWHMFVPGLRPGQVYAYRVHGPQQPQRGLRFDGSKVLIDPYSRAVLQDEHYDRAAAVHWGQDNCQQAMKSVVVDPADYDWEGDLPLRTPFSRTVIYEVHVRGFTRHPTSGVAAPLRGTYRGLIEKIPYLKQLGITAVELLPVQQFDPQDKPPAAKTNYWGYAPIAFFAPHAGYCVASDPLAPVREFRDMVKALHRAGIEVILDVVFNHTAEGNEQGPTLCHRGFENRAYYMLAPDNRYYMNYSGCGNTLNANHSIVRRMVLECLRYWVSEMHVDGFRFDLAAVLSRDEQGHPLPNPPILWEIESDPVLASTKIIAEAWDAAGLYQVGTFTGHRWAEWNGRFRDDVRHFLKGNPGAVSALATRLLASPDLYAEPDRALNRSINFVTCHDGFTLRDLVSYNDKHNEANGEQNRDGDNNNQSWNCGAEGPTEDAGILRLRDRQVRNFLTLLLLAQGTPMLLMGDELGRSQQGNNNAYCQDNEISWLDWSLVEHNSGLLCFVQNLLAFIAGSEVFSHDDFWSSLTEDARYVLRWHGTQLDRPDWSWDSHCLAFSLRDCNSAECLFVMINAFWQCLEFELPPLQGAQRWARIVDTALASPDDCCSQGMWLPEGTVNYRVTDRSIVVLCGRNGTASQCGAT